LLDELTRGQAQRVPMARSPSQPIHRRNDVHPEKMQRGNQNLPQPHARKLRRNMPATNLQPGDLLLHSSKGEISKLIQWVSDSDYSHVAMVFDEQHLGEATSGGTSVQRPIATRLSDRVQFHRIDAFRHASVPLPEADTVALQRSAREMQGRPFALNQMFELGVICLVKNKVPPDLIAKAVLTWVFERLVRPDPQRLLCSEFVYLAFHNASTQPPKRLDPTIVVTRHPPRSFPHVDWLKLWQEYADASSPEAATLPRLGELVGDRSAAQIDTAFEQARQTARQLLNTRREHMPAAERASRGPHPNPELILPQDLADSPSFKLLATVNP
jgi:hypothetical protein